MDDAGGFARLTLRNGLLSMSNGLRYMVFSCEGKPWSKKKRKSEAQHCDGEFARHGLEPFPQGRCKTHRDLTGAMEAKKKTSNKFSPEVRERAVRMVLEHRGEHASQWAAIGSIAAKIGCTAETLRNWVRQAERDTGAAAGRDDGRARADQGAGAGEPRAAAGQRDPAQGVGVFCPGGARPPVQAMIAFIDDHRDAHGVEPICKVLPIAPSTYHDACGAPARSDEAVGASPARRGACARRSGACWTRTSRSTACARSGGS